MGIFMSFKFKVSLRKCRFHKASDYPEFDLVLGCFVLHREVEEASGSRERCNYVPPFLLCAKECFFRKSRKVFFSQTLFCITIYLRQTFSYIGNLLKYCLPLLRLAKALIILATQLCSAKWLLWLSELPTAPSSLVSVKQLMSGCGSLASEESWGSSLRLFSPRRSVSRYVSTMWDLSSLQVFVRSFRIPYY